jgi:glycosyltransferase involved in cell wall biosynthesis
MENKKPNKEELQLKIKEFVSKIDSKDFNIYFYCTDTKGNALASVAQIYGHVKTLTGLGYKAHILTDSDKYTSVETWLGKDYAELSHIPLTKTITEIDPITKKPVTKTVHVDIKITNTDFLIVPEVYANIMQQVTKLPCKKIVFCQNYTFISEILPLDKSWSLYGFNDVITTSDELSLFVKSINPSATTYQTPILINDSLFNESKKSKKPYISFVTKDQSDFRVITNMFYRKYPIFRWFTPRDLRNLSQEEFAEALKESCVLVWVDKRSTFGTAPIEAMKCGVPVIGVIPELIPYWMKEETEEGLSIKQNGVWVGSILEIADILNNFCQDYLEDDIPTEITDAMKTTIIDFNYEKSIEGVEKLYSTMFENRKVDILALANEKEIKTEEEK